jgi:sphinganine-1-phosphate aldolase
MIVVLVRTVRPYIPILFATWLLARVLLPSARDLSLWDGLYLFMAYLKQASLETAALSPWASGYVPLVSFAWAALEDFLAVSAFFAGLRLVYYLWHVSPFHWKQIVTDTCFHWILNHVPFVESSFDNMASKVFATEEFEKTMNKYDKRTIYTSMPSKGLGPEATLKLLTPYSEDENEKWMRGKQSGTVYHGNEAEHTDLMNKSFATYTWANPLHIGLWPKLNQCGAEVIAMTGSILHAPQPIKGSITSGGTESIICAIRASLNYYGKRRGIAHPELICGTSAHAAVDKACDLMGIRQVTIDCSQGDYTLCPAKVKAAITSNTIMIYASAPTYPQGVIDPIQSLSKIAQSYDIGLHVDACLGGFVLGFWDDAPLFDFRVPGVTSMSIDTHKYGYCAKGTSVVVYRDKKLRHAQYFCFAKWSGGMYATPTLAGSRPGALDVCAWASIMSLGRDGYREKVKQIIRASHIMAKGVDETPGVKLMTKNPSVVVCFGSDELDVYSIGKGMKKKGWVLNELQNPTCLHICVTVLVASKAEGFVKELRECVEEERLQCKTGNKSGAGIYGLAGAMPEGPVNHMLKEFMDIVLAP